MVMGEEESINCEEAFDSIFSHFIQEFVIDSVLGEYRFAFDETEENMSDEEVIIPDSVGDWLHPTIKCTDLSKSTDKLFDVRRLHESFDLDLEDEEEELISNIILDRLIEGTQEAITFQITESNEQDTDVTQEADTVQSVENNEQGNSFLDMVTDGTQERVTFQVNESNEQGNKFIDRERAKSHHFGVGRTSSIRNVYNTIFHRSKSSTKRVKEPEELENLVSNKKNRRFFKRTRRKKQEPTPTSIEVQEGTDVSSQVQSKLISRLFTGQKANRGQENDNEKMLDGTGHSRTVLGGIRNSLMNLFRNRVVV
ncbi:uncharacterized protein LOC134680620 isoform X2 [Mytilus trossulus]|uniref:uncharacterized protein LOC134680620 isoform X2 n=1 Tax=Mytilus trossulus TaxID=6551 RepID=UPI003006B70C